jgi:predicted aconitase
MQSGKFHTDVVIVGCPHFGARVLARITQLSVLDAKLWSKFVILVYVI